MEARKAKKRQCVLCDDGKVVTTRPKDRAVCADCAIKLMDGECKHTVQHICGCPCHEPGSLVLHIMPCCSVLRCEHCDKQISSSQIEHHISTCHATLLELLEE